MKETLSTIASRLGVSCSTVSRVLGGKAESNRIPRATADRILAEARRCHYTSSRSGKGLRGSGVRAIGLVMPSLSNPFFAEMTDVIVSEVSQRGYTPIVVDTLETEENESAVIEALRSSLVEGLIVAPSGGEEELLALSDAGLPVVLVDRYFENVALPYVTTNNYKGGVMGTQTLLDYGHKDIVCLQGLLSSMPNRMRVSGYKDTMIAAGLEDKIRIVGNEFSARDGYISTRLLLAEESTRPSAIFALSNASALGAMKAMRELNLRIPEDISLISFDRNTYMEYMTPSVSCISQPSDDMARLAVKILFERIEDPSLPASHIMLTPNLVPGGSIRAVK